MAASILPISSSDRLSTYVLKRVLSTARTERSASWSPDPIGESHIPVIEFGIQLLVLLDRERALIERLFLLLQGFAKGFGNKMVKLIGWYQLIEGVDDFFR
jgi:hypothetical protein